MPLTRVEAAELILSARRSAGRCGHSFVLNRERLASIGGFSAADIGRIERAVDQIEEATSAILNDLRL